MFCEFCLCVFSLDIWLCVQWQRGIINAHIPAQRRFTWKLYYVCPYMDLTGFPLALCANSSELPTPVLVRLSIFTKQLVVGHSASRQVVGERTTLMKIQIILSHIEQPYHRYQRLAQRAHTFVEWMIHIECITGAIMKSELI